MVYIIFPKMMPIVLENQKEDMFLMYFTIQKLQVFGNGLSNSQVYEVKGLIQDKNSPKEYRHVSEISIFDNYFRHLYRMFKYIDVSPLIDDTERYDYACIVRATSCLIMNY